jgi:cell division protein FtsB
MKFLKRFFSCIIGFFGGIFILAGVHSLVDGASPQPATFISFTIVVGLPLSIFSLWLWTSANQIGRVSQAQQAQLEEKRRQAVLYQLIQDRAGEFTLLEFAIASQLPADSARTYLDAQARAFGADYNITETGEIVYQFKSQ